MPSTLFDSSEQAGWLVIVGWEKFQHYRDRDPIWIKNYLDQLDRDEYLDLSLATRGLLQDLRLLTARRRGRVRLDTAKISRALGVRVTLAQLEALRDAGFVAFSASDPASGSVARAPARAGDRARGEGEKEKEPPQTPPQTRGGSRLSPKALRGYTGCIATRGSHGTGWKHSILGRDKPPPDWPHGAPSELEIRVAIARQWIDENAGGQDETQVLEQLAYFGVNGEHERPLLEHAAEIRTLRTDND